MKKLLLILSTSAYPVNIHRDIVNFITIVLYLPELLKRQPQILVTVSSASKQRQRGKWAIQSLFRHPSRKKEPLFLDAYLCQAQVPANFAEGEGCETPIFTIVVASKISSAHDISRPLHSDSMTGLCDVHPSRATTANNSSSSSPLPRSNNQHQTQSDSSPNISTPTHQLADHDNNRSPRRQRKPSPGLAARFKALGFGRDASPKPTSISPGGAERIGRIPEDHIHKLESLHRAASFTFAGVQRRGRACSGERSNGHLTPQPFGDGKEYFTPAAGDSRAAEVGTRRPLSADSNSDHLGMTVHVDESDIDSLKYRLPDHTNGNGTKAMSDTKQAHIEREVPDEENPPPPIGKDTPIGGTTFGEITGDASSYFNPFALQRAGSVYTLSRVSFASQLAQLTSLQLPDAESLSTKVSAIPTSKAASKALMGAAEQIRSWISKASEVISGLDGEDDVEWAAAGGREGLAEVDAAITRFEQLINVYVSAIEALQSRQDIADVPTIELGKVVTQVEAIVSEWEKIKKTLQSVKHSVEIAMEWEELWNTVLGDIGSEMDILARLVFEMEEKRHKSLIGELSGDGVDINELETIVEETPPAKTRIQANKRCSLSTFPLRPSSPQASTLAQDDSSLLALFARMQPLRASLDFLPMRLSTFFYRAERIFPTACEELETRRDGLEASWKDLGKDAESLRRELGEDRWVLVFRGAGRQAQKMYESVERSLAKLVEALDAGAHLNNPATMGKKIESYEAKKMHYGPAIERVLSIIEKGVKDRLTVNGEILRLHSDLQRKWENLKERVKEVDFSLEEIQADKRNQQLRDSISSMVSNDRSTLGSFNDTPGSSPASSVVMTGISRELDPLTPQKNGKVRLGTNLPQPGRNRISSAPSTLPRKGLTSHLSSYGGSSPSLSRQSTATPTGNRLPRPTLPTSLGDRPKWNSSVNTKDIMVGHNFKPLSSTTPSLYSKSMPPLTRLNRSTDTSSMIPLRSPLSRDNTSENLAPPTINTPPSRPSSNSRLSFRDRVSSPGPYSQQVLAQQSPSIRPRNLTSQSSVSILSQQNRRASLQPSSSGPSSIRPASSLSTSNRRVSLQPSTSDPTSFTPPSRILRPSSSLANSGNTPTKTTSPGSSLAGNRRTSLLPTPRGRQNSGVKGRENPQAIAGAASAMRRERSEASTGSSGGKQPFRI
ncbi:cortical protein KAR9-domain-containing protein [Calycina marina]|uniref:Cortical protein KAR9-domain-containing protein n=1 Tax=Calycina marina TaxID=1763456 RepID=A0A9P7Z8G9_9HELO|nr:cortical protein KAR9-domain-containing protein [Calycina marina]